MEFKFDEKELEDYLYENPSVIADILKLDYDVFDGFTDVTQIIRQPNFQPYGYPDLVVVEQDNKLVHVLELKVTPAKIEHLAQTARYMKGIMRTLKHMQIDDDYSVFGHLIAPKIAPNHSDKDFLWILQQIPTMWFHQMEWSFESGIRFDIVNPAQWYNEPDDPISTIIDIVQTELPEGDTVGL